MKPSSSRYAPQTCLLCQRQNLRAEDSLRGSRLEFQLWACWWPKGFNGISSTKHWKTNYGWNDIRTMRVLRHGETPWYTIRNSHYSTLSATWYTPGTVVPFEGNSAVGNLARHLISIKPHVTKRHTNRVGGCFLIRNKTKQMRSCVSCSLLLYLEALNEHEAFQLTSRFKTYDNGACLQNCFHSQCSRDEKKTTPYDEIYRWH